MSLLPTNKVQPVRRLNLQDVGAIAVGDPSLPALICLHGWGGSRDIWRRFLELYGPSRFLVSIDLPGTRGTRPIGKWESQGFVDWLLVTADRIGIDRFAIMGHSMGGNTAAHVAAAAPDRVESLVLVNAAIYSNQLQTAQVYVEPSRGPLMVQAARLGSGIVGGLSALFPENDRGGSWRPWLRRCGYFYHHNTPDVLHRQLKSMVESPFDPVSLPKSLPVLVFHGEKDTVVPVELARQLWQTLIDERGEDAGSNTKLIVYPDAQHVPMDSAPHRFVGDVRSFLDGE